MDKLSNELKDCIFHNLKSNDLKTLRLVSTSVSRSATRLLFSTICVIPCEESLTAFTSIAAAPALREQVISIKCSTHGDPDPYAYGKGTYEGPPKKLPSEYREGLGLIASFPKLRHVEVEFSPRCQGLQVEVGGGGVAEDIGFRADVLSALFSALGCGIHKSTIHSLTLTNLQNYNDKIITSSEIFKSVLSTLSELSLDIATEDAQTFQAGSWGQPELYSFFHELPTTWLHHAQNNLTSLALSCVDYFGYMPKLDLRSLHFPRLQALELGNYIFTHSWQLSWIVSHSSSLKILRLNDCAIAPIRQNFGEVDSEGYPICQEKMEGEETFWKYNTTWDEFFSTFENEFPRLEQFVFGKRYSRIGHSDAPVILEEERYLVFLGSNEGCPWSGLDYMLRQLPSEDEDSETKMDEWWDGRDKVEECAYLKLMASLKRRRNQAL